MRASLTSPTCMLHRCTTCRWANNECNIQKTMALCQLPKEIIVSARRNFEWPELLTADGRGIAFGGDYNPDQWSGGHLGRRHPPDEAGRRQHRRPRHLQLGPHPTAPRTAGNFGWLDRIIDKLGKAGIAVDLASATATAPLWLYEQHPEVLPRDKYGHPGQRRVAPVVEPDQPGVQGIRADAVPQARRTVRHQPRMSTAWHMGNEYGWNNREDYCDNALEAFRALVPSASTAPSTRSISRVGHHLLGRRR